MLLIRLGTGFAACFNVHQLKVFSVYSIQKHHLELKQKFPCIAQDADQTHKLPVVSCVDVFFLMFSV